MLERFTITQKLIGPTILMLLLAFALVFPDMVEMINGISLETNLLAMNAA